MSNKGKPFLPNIEPLIKAGINPETNLPYKMGSSSNNSDYKKILRVIDEQTAVNRFVWKDTKLELSTQEIERLIYIKYNLIFLKLNGKFYLMPFAPEGTLDYYGRWNFCHPVPVNSAGTDKQKGEIDKESYETLSKTLALEKRTIVYSLEQIENLSEEERNNCCVIIRDYSPTLSLNGISRQILNDSILEQMSYCIPYMDTALILSTGVTGMRVPDADQKNDVIIASNQIKKSASNGLAYVPITSPLELQQLNEGTPAKANEFMLAMQSLDNFRMSTYGLSNSGLFEKQAHELQTEADMSTQKGKSALIDSLEQRKYAVELINALFGLNILVELGESAQEPEELQIGVNVQESQENNNEGEE